MSCLVTGGLGFIGSNLIRNHHEDLGGVRVLDNLSTGSIQSIQGSPVEVVEGDICNLSEVLDSASGCSGIIHLAAICSVSDSVSDPVRNAEVNYQGTLHVLEAARQFGIPVFLASTSAVYGNSHSTKCRETDLPHPLSPYAANKLASEAAFAAYSDSYGISGAIFRFFNVFGPGQRPDHPYAAVVPRFLAQAVLGLPLTVTGDGKQTRDFVSVDFIARVVVQAFLQGLNQTQPLNVGSGTARSVMELANLIRELAELEPKVIHVAARRSEVRDSVADTSMLTSRLGVTYADGSGFDADLQSTLNWMRENLLRDEATMKALA